jgi:hypothetical protein
VNRRNSIMNNMLKYILNGGNERARIERKQQEE